MNYYRRHIGDYARDTRHLTLLEHGAYAMLMDIYYATEKGIPDSDAEKLICAKSKAERLATRAILKMFFKFHDGEWTQKRCADDIRTMKEIGDNARENGKKGGRPKTQKVPENNQCGSEKEPSGLAPNSHKPVAISHIPPPLRLRRRVTNPHHPKKPPAPEGRFGTPSPLRGLAAMS